MACAARAASAEVSEDALGRHRGRGRNSRARRGGRVLYEPGGPLNTKPGPSTPGPSTIQVGGIYIYSPDNVCGLNANPIYFDGFNGSTAQVQTLDFPIPNYNGSACAIRSLTTNTTGFTLSAIQVPLGIAGGGSGSMNITVTARRPRSPGT